MMTFRKKKDELFIHCVMCFKIIRKKSKQWIMYEQNQIEDFVNNYCSHIEYMHITKYILLEYKTKCDGKNDSMIKICDHCSVFIRKTMAWIVKNNVGEVNVCYNASRNIKINHPLQNVIQYIERGGIGQRPPKGLLINYIESFSSIYPLNPIFNCFKYETLYRMVQGIKQCSELLSLSIYDFEKFICFVKWILCGAPRFIKNPKFAKAIRKYFGCHPEHKTWFQRLKVPTACRFCCKKLKRRQNQNAEDDLLNIFKTSYVNVCITNGSLDTETFIETKLRRIEHNVSNDHTNIFFCEVCCKVSVISFEYNEKVETLLNMNSMREEKKRLNEYEYYIKIIIEKENENVLI
jgi:hypothetical protein